MTKAQVNETIRAAAKAHGFETTAEPGFQGITEIISGELNFIFTVRNTENTDWAAHRIEQSLTVSASVRRMGGNPTVEELLTQGRGTCCRDSGDEPHLDRDILRRTRQ